MQQSDIPPDEADESDTASPLNRNKLSELPISLVLMAVLAITAFPKTLDQYRVGAVILTLLVTLTLVSWVTVTWIQYG